RITDPSGFDVPRVTASHDSGQTSDSFDFGPSNLFRVSGDDKDGTWQADISISQGSAAGEWSISLFPLRDSFGNSGFFGPPSAFPKIFTVEPYSSPDDSIGDDQSETLYVRLNSNPFAAPYYIFSFTENGPAESIQLIKGQTYEFIRTDGGHPFNIGSGWREADSSITLSSTSSNDSFAVAGVASIEVGARLILTIPETFNGGSLAYYCYSHSSMVANLVVLSSSGSEGGSLDTDSDGMPDASDNDDDGDGLFDNQDPYPLDGSRPFYGGLVSVSSSLSGVFINSYAQAGSTFSLTLSNNSEFDIVLEEFIGTDGSGTVIANTEDLDLLGGDGVLEPSESVSLQVTLNLATPTPITLNYTYVNPEDGSTEFVSWNNDGVIEFSYALDSDFDGLDNNVDIDDDNDGMPDVWEIRYGLNPNDSSDAESDQDNDGVTAYDEFIAGTIPAGSLDIDGNGQYDALTDGLLLLRGMFLLSGDSLISNAVASDAVYKTSDEVASRIDMLGDLVDIDGNGSVDALTDGLMILRYLFNLRGDVLINDVIASDATVKTAEDVEAKIESLMPAT
ncbi:MAG: hypothetical protein P8P22_08665, partial [Porticoccaceae bacterium]|nr:hypothetical protein [Porticoccaceae bacterium]